MVDEVGSPPNLFKLIIMGTDSLDRVERVSRGDALTENLCVDESYEAVEFSKFEIALSFVSNYLNVLIPDLQARMADAKFSDNDDGDDEWSPLADDSEICNWLVLAKEGEFCENVAREIKDLSYVYYEVILGFIETEFCMAGIDGLKDSSVVDVINDIVKNLRDK